MPLLAPNVIPRLEFRVKPEVDCNIPPLIVRWSAVVDPGTAPNPLSALTLKVPALIDVDPA